MIFCRLCRKHKDTGCFAKSEAAGTSSKCVECTKYFKIKNRYGLTKAQYDAMLVAQDFKCAMCKRPPKVNTKGLIVDHNHDTGKVRALLCNGCNSIIGYAEGDQGPQLLLEALKYVLKHSS